jgi:two-component system KDP operon response regulator KdpE
MKTVIIEDDETIVEFISLAFQTGWPDVEVLSTKYGQKGIKLVEIEMPKLLILDLGLPDMSGFEVLKRVRAFSDVATIIITVNEEESDIVKALQWGADEYIVKPFRQMEFLARIKALMRRGHSTVESFKNDVYKIGEWSFDTQKHVIQRLNKTTFLTRSESTILLQLIRNRGHVVNIHRLVGALWGEDYPGAVEAIRVYVRRLRSKIEYNSQAPQIILTKIGEGYYIEGFEQNINSNYG